MLSKNRGVHYVVTHVRLGGTGYLVLSAPAGRLSLRDVRTFGGGLGLCGKGVLFSDRSRRFVRAMTGQVVRLAPGNVVSGVVRCSRCVDDSRVGRLGAEVCKTWGGRGGDHVTGCL